MLRQPQSDLWLFIHASNLSASLNSPPHLQTADSYFHFWHHVWMLLAECGENISLSHTAHIKKYPDSIVGKRQRPQAFLVYSYVISMAIGTWHSVLQSQHTYLSDVWSRSNFWVAVHASPRWVLMSAKHSIVYDRLARSQTESVTFVANIGFIR